MSPEQGSVDVVFLVRDETEDVVKHARVIVVTHDGSVSFGNDEGLLKARVPRELFVEGGGALLVCAEGYYCGGWLANEVPPS